MKNYFTLILILLSTSLIKAQLALLTTGDSYTIDFTGFAGDGFDAAGSPGYLDADTWAIMGFSDGNKDFGVESTTGDFARGTTMGGESTGGVYGVDILDNQGILVQPTETDFTPGSIRLKILNNTGDAIGQLDIGYAIFVYNDQNRSGSFNFAHSSDNITYTDEPSLDYTSGEAAAILPETATKSISIIGLNIPDGGFYYLKWEGNDVGGTGSRDEFALDDIVITPFAYTPTSEIQFASIVISAEEGETVTPTLIISESADCSVEVYVDISSTATAGMDYDFTSPLVLNFTSGGSTSVTFDFPTTDDSDVEPGETVILKLNNVTGGCVLGFSDTYNLNILDNDAASPTISDIADVTTEDINGIAESIGEYVQLTGIVYGINLSEDEGLDFYILDEASGIRVFQVGDSLGYSVNSGDRLTVVGIIDQYNGLTQIIPESITIVNTGNTTPPHIFTLTSVDDSYEGKYVQFSENVVVVDPTQWLGDGSTFLVEIEEFGGGLSTNLMINQNMILSTVSYESFISMGAWDDFVVKGIFSQIDETEPYLDGYVLIPMFENSDFDFTHSLNNVHQGQIELYPNPTSDWITLKSKNVMESVEIYNHLGQLINSYSVKAFEQKIDVQQLIGGIYFVKVKTENGISTSVICKL